VNTSRTAKLPATRKPSRTVNPPAQGQTARALRRAKALRSRTVLAIYLVIAFSVLAAICELHGRAAAARPAPRRVVPAPSVAAPAPVVEAPRSRGPVPPAPPGAAAPWGGWNG
jgi:hypothetical protein